MRFRAVMEQERRGRRRIHKHVGTAPGRQHQRAVARGEGLGGLAIDGHDANVMIF